MYRIFFLFVLASIVSINSFSQPDAKIEVVAHNHVALQVKDIQQSTNFYRDVLGLESIPVPDSLKAIRSWFKLGTNQQIHLLAGRTIPVNNDRNGSHFALFVKSISSTEAYLVQHKMPFHKQVRFDGSVQIYLADPDGYLIEFNEAKKQ